MGAVSFSIPQELVKTLSGSFKIQNFVETGTFKGNTSIWAASHFEKVYTIEISPEFSKIASKRPDAKPNIEFLIGDSKTVLPRLMDRLIEPTMFWLDGHWCMDAGGKDHECPLIDELVVVSTNQKSIILIDDARCFLGPLPPPHRSGDWPRIDEIFSKIREIFPYHTTTIIDDVIVSVPPELKGTLDDFWKKTYKSRFTLTHALQNYSKLNIIKYLLRSIAK